MYITNSYQNTNPRINFGAIKLGKMNQMLLKKQEIWQTKLWIYMKMLQKNI